MKELDFDELDRAVNSLMTDVPKTDLATPDEHEKTLEITPTLNDGASLPATNPEKDTASQTSTQAVPASTPPPLAARRGGRFMDVVHPSSDMKKPLAPRPVSRQGVTVRPRPTTQVQETESPLSEPSQKASTAPPVTTEPVAPTNDWPDPLEMTQPSVTNAPVSSLESQDQPETPQAIDKPLPKQDEPERSPLTSPFLPDTKVEKRPLGTDAMSVAGEPDHTPVLAASTQAPATDVAAQLPANPTDIETPLPEELQGDLMAIEADTTSHANKKSQVDAPDKHVEKDEEVPLLPAHASADAPAVSSGPTSIPQQYREEPSTSDPANGAIYDTDTYHQPLAHPAKKKSGWLWVVWILLILIAGASAGAALFFSGII